MSGYRCAMRGEWCDGCGDSWKPARCELAYPDRDPARRLGIAWGWWLGAGLALVWLWRVWL